MCLIEHGRMNETQNITVGMMYVRLLTVYKQVSIISARYIILELFFF